MSIQCNDEISWAASTVKFNSYLIIIFKEIEFFFGFAFSRQNFSV